MKFFRNRAVAWAILVLAIAASCLWGLHKKPADVPKVSYYNWISDNAKLLNNDTVQTIEQYNSSWDGKYRAIVAVASVDHIRGWKDKKFCAELGGDWGLGPNDMLLLLVKNGDYYIACGDNIIGNDKKNIKPAMTDTQQSKLQSAIEPYYYKGDFNSAVTAFFRQADIVYAQMNSSNLSQTYDATKQWPEKHYSSSLHIGGVILLIVAILVIWILLDRVRYNRYQRRSTYVVGGPRTVYYPVFWGRRRVAPPPHYTPTPHTTPRPTSHHSTSYRAPAAHRTTGTRGSFGSGSSRTGTSHTSRPSGGFSGKGFGGGKHR